MGIKKGFGSNARSWMILLAILAGMMMVSISHVRADEKGNALLFYPHVDSLIQYPHSADSLAILHKKKINDSLYVTFIGFRSTKKILLAAVTKTPLAKVAGNIILSVDFDGVLPKPGRITTWCYVYDRNGDGKIDYMAMLGGAAPVKRVNEKLPEDFPKRMGNLSRDQLEIFVSHCQLVFNHWADDNYDGVVDAAIQSDLDPDRDWVDRNIVIRSTKFDGLFDDVWAFRGWPGDEQDSTVEHTSSTVQYHPIGKPKDTITPNSFSEKTNILQLLNRAAAETGIKKENFRTH